MNKEDFLRSLERLLRSLKKEERKKFTTYYEEIIDDYVEDGCTEEEAVKRIGNPGTIAQEILSDRDMAEPKPVSIGMKVGVITLLILGCPLWGSLLLAALCLALSGVLLVLSVYILIWCIPLLTGALAIAALSLSVVGMGGGAFLALENVSLGVMQIGSGILFAGIFLLSGIATWELSKKFIKITVWFSKWLSGLLRRKAGAKA